MLNINSRKVVIHNMTIRGIESVPGILDYDQRGILFAKDEDIVVTRRTPEKSYLQYLENLGWDFRNVTFISPNDINKFKYNSIFYDAKIITFLKGKKNLYIDSYQSTEEEDIFSQKVKIPLFAAINIASKYGIKSGFRKLCRKLKLNIPDGYEDVKNIKQAITAISNLFNKGTDAVVIKLDEGISGAGNTKITREFLKKEGKDKEKIVKIALSKIPQQAGNNAVVEEWIKDLVSSPSIQLMINYEGEIRILSLHDQILEGKEKWYIGCIYPPQSINKNITKKIKKEALIFGKYLKKQGFYGYFGIDTLVERNGTIWWTEANLRKPATFYPRVIAEKLNNDTLENIFYIASDFTVEKFKGVNFFKILNYFKKYLYPLRGEKRGIVLYNIGALKEAGRFDLVCFGKDSKDAFTIFTAIKNKIKNIP